MEKGAYTVDSGMPGGDPVISGVGSAVPNGGFANGGFAAPGAGLVVPTGGSTVSENGDIILNPNTKKKKKIWMVIGCVVIVLLLVGIGFGVWAIVDNNKKQTMNNVREFSSLLSWVRNNEQCASVVDDASNIDTTRNEYDHYIEDCEEKTEKTLRLLADLRGLSGSSEYKRIYESLSGFIDERMVSGSELDEKLNAYRTWHEFILNANEMDYFTFSDEIEKISRPVIEIGNDDLTTYMTKWARKREALNEAYILMSMVDSEQRRNDYYLRKEDYDSFISNGIDVDKAIGFRKNLDNSDFTSALAEFNLFTLEEL